MDNVTDSENKILPPHHIQQQLCETRPLYRQGRKLTAVKVYTVNNESQHLIIYKVPKINLSNELKSKCAKYGELKKFEVVTKYKTDAFTENFHVFFDRIQSARIAKRFLDNSSFYGEILHVCYAPEYENISETKRKLLQRQKDVLSRLQPGPTVLEYANMELPTDEIHRKRKHPALPLTDKRLKSGGENIWREVPTELDPRLTNTNNQNIGFKKHYQIATTTSPTKNVQYGPFLPSVLCSPGPSDKKENNTKKRIIFKKKQGP